MSRTAAVPRTVSPTVDPCTHQHDQPHHDRSPVCLPLARQGHTMSLFSLDILEPSLISRPSPSPRIPLQQLSSSSTVVQPSTPSKQPRKTEEPGPPRWNTPEFWFYGFAFATVVPLMCWTAWTVSRRNLFLSIQGLIR